MEDGHNGIKGKTPITKLKFFKFPTSVAKDYMHSICLGVIKRMFFFWFNSTQDKKYCLKTRMIEINEKFMKIKPSDYIKTAPRDLINWAKLKAYEFLNFLLFYSLIVFHNLMPAEYYSNLIKLVVSLEFLLS